MTIIKKYLCECPHCLRRSITTGVLSMDAKPFADLTFNTIND